VRSFFSTYTLVGLGHNFVYNWDKVVIYFFSCTTFVFYRLISRGIYSYLKPEEYYVAGDGVDIHEHVLHHNVDVRTLA
jgi:hypothetical protein